MSTRARLCIREVVRELEEDMELGAEGDLNAVAPSTSIFPPSISLSPWSPPRSLSLALSVAVVSAALCRPLISHTRNGSLLGGSLMGLTSH